MIGSWFGQSLETEHKERRTVPTPSFRHQLDQFVSIHRLFTLCFRFMVRITSRFAVPTAQPSKPVAAWNVPNSTAAGRVHQGRPETVPSAPNATNCTRERQHASPPFLANDRCRLSELRLPSHGMGVRELGDWECWNTGTGYADFPKFGWEGIHKPGGRKSLTVRIAAESMGRPSALETAIT
jgi:hypothetical protein